MDNVTHSLVGLAVGEAVAVYTGNTSARKRVPIWIASAVANNLPDFDLILTSAFFRDRLGYLLHHRGHSHTITVAPLWSICLLAILAFCWRKRNDVPWKPVLFVAFLGPPTHLFADYWNSYGVHPFWPFDDHWIYGDLSFIVEPWVWVLLIPAIFLRTTSRWVRGLLLALEALILGLAWQHSLVSRPAAALLTGVAVIWALVQSRALKTEGLRIGTSLAAVGCLLLGLAGLSARVKALDARGSGEIAASPFPANPLCWNVIRAGHEGQEYVASLAIVAPFPALQPAQTCPALYGHSFTAPLEKPAPSDSPAELKIGTFRAPWSELESLRQDCRAEAFLRFARTPFWKREGNAWRIGDLRFDRGQGGGFSSLQLTDPPLPLGSPACPTWLPPWIGRFSP